MRLVSAAAIAAILLVLPAASQLPAERIALATNIPVEEWSRWPRGGR